MPEGVLLRARLVLCVLATVAFGGCAGIRPLRERAERRMPIVPQHEAVPLEPAAGLALVNLAHCLECGGSAGCLFFAVGCACVIGTVDLVALPVQSVRRDRQRREIERIASSCPVSDPGARAAAGLAGALVGGFGFRPAPSPPSPEVPAGEVAAVLLEVRTTRFERSSRIGWAGDVVLREGRDVLWRESCDAETPAREVDRFERECEAAREEVAALADRCVESIVQRLREAWGEPVGQAQGERGAGTAPAAPP